MKTIVTLPFSEGDIVYTPKGEANVLAWDYTFRVKYKGKSLVNGDAWNDAYGDYSLDAVGHSVFTSIQEQGQANCPHYRKEGGIPCCSGTKESDLCSCRGNKKDCDFYTYDDDGKYIGLKQH